METYSSGGSRRKRYISKSEIEKLKKGGIKAQKIKKEADAIHRNTEIPNAEKMLAEKINTVFQSNLETTNTTTRKKDKRKGFEKFLHFIKKIFFQPQK